MYLSSWKRTVIYEKLPFLKGDNTLYSKEIIDNPNTLDFWNFFISHKKVRFMQQMAKDIPINSLISVEGENALDLSLSMNYLPLVKTILKKFPIKKINISNEEDLSIIDKSFNSKFSIYKEIMLFIKNNKSEHFFSNKHMELLSSSEIDKMIFFEKTFPDLFLNIYNKPIDSLNPHFQHVLMKNDILKKRLNKKLKKRITKKVLVKI